MKILVSYQYYYPEPFRITDICEELVKRGHEVTILTGLPNYPEGIVPKEYRHGKRRDEIRNGVRVIRTFEIGRGGNKVKLFLNYLSFTLSSWLKVKKLSDDYEVVFADQTSPITSVYAAIRYQKLHQVPLLLYCLDLWPDSLIAGGIKKGSPIFRMFKRISRNIYKQADRIAVTSYSFIEYFEKEMGMNARDMIYLPQYSEDLFSTIELKREEKNGFDFVFAGNVGRVQSVETIIRAAYELRNRTDIRFHIVGSGSNLAECKKMAKNRSNVIFYGRRPVEDMPRLYAMADAMLITLKDDPVISKTLPGKIQTYMAAAKPVIGAINGEAAFVIKDAQCGYCCAAEDVKGLAKIILCFIEAKDREQMGKNARNYYLEHYDKEIFFCKLEEIFSSFNRRSK